ncbi:MAG: hypothetical protein OEW12_07740, partial [Deltaproteobacteria bacterium]|nr:hypothetical protein [Deltaproteobacteria bacterium]
MDIHFKDLAVAPRVQGLEAEVRRDAAVLGLPQDKVEASLAARDYFGVLELYVPLLYSGIQMEAGPARALQTTLEELLRIKTFTHPLAWRGVEGVVHSMVPVVFGTAGHRGEIGLGLTLFHVHVIIGAFIQMVEAMAPHDRAAHFGAADLDHVKEMGMVLGHDNRLFNPEFSAYAAHLLANAGYRVMYGARVSTPELSRVVPYRGFAGAVNFTPSHNPFRYGGIKLNPADGGLAGPELTDSLAVEANRMMKELPGRDWLEYDALDSLVGDRLASLVRVDVHSAYLEALALHPVIRLDELCQTLKEMGSKAAWAVDPTWGASVPVYQRLQEKVGSEVMTVLHTEDDSYFGGQ